MQDFDGKRAEPRRDAASHLIGNPVTVEIRITPMVCGGSRLGKACKQRLHRRVRINFGVDGGRPPFDQTQECRNGAAFSLVIGSLQGASKRTASMPRTVCHGSIAASPHCQRRKGQSN